MPGGQPSPISDTSGEKKGTWLLLLFLFMTVGLAILFYNPNLDDLGAFFLDNWWILPLALVAGIFFYRAYQGVGLFPSLDELHISIKGLTGTILVVAVAAFLLVQLGFIPGFDDSEGNDDSNGGEDSGTGWSKIGFMGGGALLGYVFGGPIGAAIGGAAGYGLSEAASYLGIF